MAASAQASNKAKIARRVIEVLEFFDDDHPEATVMDIVRRYDRPQSSTSELLSSLVELGLLHKDAYSRSYRPTVRAALLGVATQSEVVRDGRLMRFTDRLMAQTALPVALFSRACLDTQVVSIRRGRRMSTRAGSDLHGGRKEAMTRNAAGWMLLSTLDEAQRNGTLRRLNAEADDAGKFNHAEMVERVVACARDGHAIGPAGFGSSARIVSALLPGQSSDSPLAVGILIEREGAANPEVLLQCIRDAADSCLADRNSPVVERLHAAA